MQIVPPTSDNLHLAAKILLEGGLIGMPTETVYGIACNAYDSSAVHKVFTAKGRPQDNPLIVHIASPEQLELVASSWPHYVHKLIEKFWSGPLTLVLPKSKNISNEVSGGRDTVAVRMPNHPVALALIREAGVPLAAPSANPFMRLSPTRAEHIDETLSSYLSLVLDGGPCTIGLESTVLDCTQNGPRILRPGGISREEIEAVLGQPLINHTKESVRTAPGMYPRHYAPRVKLTLIDKPLGDRPGLTFHDPTTSSQYKMPSDPTAYAAGLYDTLYELDKSGLDEIYVELPPNKPEWEAIHDRLRKASYKDS